MQSSSNLFGMYIHWPYCLSKCPYCDFFSRADKTTDTSALLNTYIRDLKFFRDIAPNKPLTSLFFGGGTPSLMQERFFENLLNEIQKLYPFAPDIEITIEANPDAINADKMHFFRTCGVNRLSLGVQSLNDADLKFLGRRHTVKTALKRLDEAGRIFPQINMDLIYARPGQTLADWEAELTAALQLDLPHYSLYQLTIEENTVFGKRGIQPTDDETAAALYQLTDTLMNAAQKPGYEVSNYAISQNECRHNLTYWTGGDYIGIGPAAHGRIGLNASENPASVPLWQRNNPVITLLTPDERKEENILMGLRLRTRDFPAELLDTDGIEKAVQTGWIEKRPGNTVRPTTAGTLMLNQLILAVCPA